MNRRVFATEARIAQNLLWDKIGIIDFIIRLDRTMIDQLRAIAIFQSVAELGSFRGAASKLNLSPSVISHHITELRTPLFSSLCRFRADLPQSAADASYVR